jgi:FMN phosphatase YigB (HAD superfamily)
VTVPVRGHLPFRAVGGGAGNDLAARIARAIAGVPVITCDIFDTAVMRRLARPEDVHLATGARAAARGLIRCAAEAFREYRLAAETAARAALGPGRDDEIGILTVYQKLQDGGVVTDAMAVAALEFAVERSVCRPVAEVRAALAARPAGQRLVFLSDTMLPSEWLARILTDCGYSDRPEVICSAEARCTKARGGLFTYALDKLGCAARDVVHLGDNPDSDIMQARKHGITAFHIPAPPISPEPEDVARQALIVRLAHSRRRSRAARHEDNATETVATALNDKRLQRICLFPLIGFTLFILAEARRRGIRRIYFMARDGHLPLAIAHRLIERGAEPFEFTYMRCSRQAILVPTLIDDLPQLARLIAGNASGQTLSAVLKILGIDPETTSSMARAAGLDPNQRISAEAGHDAVHHLLDAHRDRILGVLRERREAALAYLGQCGFLAPGPRMIVDVGWRGSVQKALVTLTGAPPTEVFGSYLGLFPDALTGGLGLDTAAGYLFSFGYPKWITDVVLQGYILFELFLSAPHGSVSHYKREGDRAVPVHADEAEPGGSVRRQALLAIEQCCLAEFDRLDEILDGAWPEALDPASALSEMTPLLTRPSARDVAAINRIPYVHGIDSTVNVPPVNPIPLHQSLRDPLRTLRRIRNAPWQGGTLRASLPWPIPDVGFPEFRDRVERLLRLLHLA